MTTSSFWKIKNNNLKEQFLETYRSEITTQTKNNYLDCLTDPTLRNINKLFIFSSKNGNDDPTRVSFDEFYKSLA